LFIVVSAFVNVGGISGLKQVEINGLTHPLSKEMNDEDVSHPRLRTKKYEVLSTFIRHRFGKLYRISKRRIRKETKLALEEKFNPCSRNRGPEGNSMFPRADATEYMNNFLEIQSVSYADS